MSTQKTWAMWKDGQLIDQELLLLRTACQEIPIPFDEAGKQDIQKVIDDFLARDDAYGLAAPQIGISKRIIVFKNKHFDKSVPVKNEQDYDVLINPKITQYRGSQTKMQEGCLSCPDITADIPRATEIKVKAFDQHGRKVNKRYRGFLARVVQHEIDHLDGKLIIDRAEMIYYPSDQENFFRKLFG